MATADEIEEYGNYLTSQGHDKNEVEDYKSYLRAQHGISDGMKPYEGQSGDEFRKAFKEHPLDTAWNDPSGTFNMIAGAKHPHEIVDPNAPIEISPESIDRSYQLASGFAIPGAAIGGTSKLLSKVTPEMAEKAGGMIGHASGGIVGHAGGGVGSMIGAKAGEKVGQAAGRATGGLLQKLSQIGSRISPKAGQIAEEVGPKADLGEVIANDAPKAPLSLEAESTSGLLKKPSADLGPEVAEGAPQGLISPEAEAASQSAAPKGNSEMLDALKEYKSKFDFSKDKRGAVEKGIDGLIKKLQTTPFENLSPNDKAGILRRVAPAASGE